MYGEPISIYMETCNLCDNRDLDYSDKLCQNCAKKVGQGQEITRTWQTSRKYHWQSFSQVYYNHLKPCFRIGCIRIFRVARPRLCVFPGEDDYISISPAPGLYQDNAWKAWRLYCTSCYNCEFGLTPN